MVEHWFVAPAVAGSSPVYHPIYRIEQKQKFMIEFNNVSRQYKLGNEIIKALDEVSLRIEDGAFVAVMGPSGSGKSTLLNLIGGLDRPNKGSVAVNGVDLHKLSDKKLAAYRNKTIGFVFQSFNLQPIYTALENVMLPLYFVKSNSQDKKQRSQKVLKLVGLEGKIKNNPNQLSGGEQQRVAIARALVNEPSILLADEPTGNLDSKNGKIIMQLIKELNKSGNITVVMVTHDEEMAKNADYILKIKDGKVR